jgi:hypothetical protein
VVGQRGFKGTVEQVLDSEGFGEIAAGTFARAGAVVQVDSLPLDERLLAG